MAGGWFTRMIGSGLALGAGLAGAAATDSAPVPAVAAAVRTAQPPRALEILSTAQERGLLTPELDRQLSELILKGLGGGAVLGAPDASSAVAAPAAGAPPEWVRLPNGVLYLFLPELPAQPERLLAAVAAAATGAGRTWVLDLRFTGGSGFAAARTAAGWFGRRAPPVVLVGPETAGAGERLAGLLKAQGATVVGRPTSGRFCELRNFKTASGSEFRLPVPAPLPPGEEAPRQVAPDVPVAAAVPRAQASGLTAERFRALPDRDPALRRAVDLASLLQAFEPREWRER